MTTTPAGAARRPTTPATVGRLLEVGDSLEAVVNLLTRDMIDGNLAPGEPLPWPVAEAVGKLAVARREIDGLHCVFESIVDETTARKVDEAVAMLR